MAEPKLADEAFTAFGVAFRAFGGAREGARRMVALLFAATACASGSPAPPESPNQSASAATPPPASSAEPAPASSSKPTEESPYAFFMQVCMKEVNSAEYCECGFQQVKEVFSDPVLVDEDRAPQLEPGDARLQLFRDKAVAACGGLLTEDQVRVSFLEVCAAKDDRKSAYCNCKWQTLRKTLALTDFLTDVEQPRFVEAKKRVVVACKGKLPVEVVQSEFMSACTEGNAADEKSCACSWKKIKARHSSEELAAGFVDAASVPGVDACFEE